MVTPFWQKQAAVRMVPVLDGAECREDLLAQIHHRRAEKVLQLSLYEQFPPRAIAKGTNS